ncbi:MAG TPA: alpha/beta hydrolase, partial [Solirubrobacterales bacterium]|nr:alpha/beta hydrolase [Solirubrobacterales bacterium]
MLRDRMDPELIEGLDAFLAAAGPGGLAAIADPVQRRATFLELVGAAPAAPDSTVATEDHLVPGPPGAPQVRLRSYRPVGVEKPLPAVYYIHGGGMVIGAIETEDAVTRWLCGAVGCVAVSVEYRLAPENPHPAPVEDCYAGLVWTAAHGEELGIDPDRIAVYGGSAGGGLAAATAILARDRGGPTLAFQMLLYPMLDDRCCTPSCREIDDIGVFDGWASEEGWRALLGERWATAAVEPAAAPARSTDLSGLPPTWIDVGELDSLRDESVEYALRLMQAGIATDLHVYPAVFHAWEFFVPGAESSARVKAERVAALRRAFALDL